MHLSVITPVLNAAYVLLACIASSEGQDCEHLFIDGGSTDGSRELLLSEGKRLIDAPGSGIYEAQNIGIAAASGDWVYILGADDVLRTGAVSQLIQAISGTEYLYARVLMSYGYIRPHYSGRQQSWVYRRSLLLERGGFTGTGLAELPFNRSISHLPHTHTGVVLCDSAMGGVSSTDYRPTCSGRDLQL